ncbi:MAG TPA: protein translocase subunit SecD [Chloroflexota bacterium]|nr:protein translocase subunit SecD [Chloroflexota bacterium]
MNRRNLIGLLVILALVGFGTWIDLPGQRNIFGKQVFTHKGLDLQGGISILLKASPPPGQSSIDADQMAAVQTIVTQRVNAFGVSEPQIQQQGSDHILVELPGIQDQDLAVKTIGNTGLLEWIDLSGNPNAKIGDKVPDNAPVVVTGKDLTNANVGIDQQTNTPEIDFQFNDEGAKKFAGFTGSHIGQPLGIALDKQLIEVATIQAQISNSGRITGRFTLDEAKSIVIQLKYGALPVPLSIEATRSVGPTLGQDSVQRSYLAGEIGLGIVLGFMLLYYRLPGVIAGIGLGAYGIWTYAIFRLWPVVLTLPGIAGFILSIGMAVDANVLIFERMKEELRSGKTLGAALEAGFSRALPSIRDSNMCTVIICIVLYFFGSNFGASIIQGFAITLLIGVIVSFCTAYFCARVFLRTMLAFIPRVHHNLAGSRLRWAFGLESQKLTPAPLPAMAGAAEGGRANG